MKIKIKSEMIFRLLEEKMKEKKIFFLLLFDCAESEKLEKKCV